MSPFFAHSLAAGGEDVTRAFDEWIGKHYPGGFVSENESHVQLEADFV